MDELVNMHGTDRDRRRDKIKGRKMIHVIERDGNVK